MTYAMLLTNVQHTSQISLPDNFGLLMTGFNPDRGLFSWVGECLRVAKSRFTR